MNDEGVVDSRELIESFLTEVRPPHDAGGYLDDYWSFVLEDVWAEGLADVVLGSAEFDAIAATDLMEEIERVAEKSGQTEDPWFDANDLDTFVKQWRSRAVMELAELKNRC